MRVLTTLTVLFLVGFQSRAQINTVPLDSIVHRAVSNNLFEGTVLIAENGATVYQKSFGSVDKDETTPVGQDSRFSIASITKMITAILTLQLVEEGKFRLSDNVATLLPELNISNSNEITVHHLLLHISGLPNENDAIYLKKASPKTFIKETLDNRYNKVGSFNYANIDYVLLGQIIEKYDGMDWQESVQRRILDKLQMKETGFLARGDYPRNFAYSFSYGDEGIRKADPLFHIENYYAAGCMYSTAQDLLKLDQAMYGEDLLSQASKESMFTSYPEYNYSGYSVWTYKYPFAKSNPKIMERRGGILGANSVLLRMLDSNRTIIILSNTNQFNPDSFGDQGSLKEALMIELANSTQ